MNYRSLEEKKFYETVPVIDGKKENEVIFLQ